MASNNLMEVNLPSKGLADDSIPEKVTLKSITVKEEKMMYGSTQADGAERALRSCIVEPEKISLKDMLPADVHFLLIKLRIHTFGPEYPVAARCPECNKKIETEVNLDDLTIHELPDDFAEPIEIKMHNGDTLGIRLLRDKDNEEIEKQATRRARQYGENKGEAEYVLRLAKLISEVNGERVPGPEALEYVENMTSRDSAYLTSVLEDEYKLGYDAVVSCTCPECGEEIEFGLPMTSEFFRPKFKRIK